MDDLIKEINTLSLGEGELLLIQVKEEVTAEQLTAFRDGLAELGDGQLQGKVAVISGDLTITKVKEGDLNA